MQNRPAKPISAGVPKTVTRARDLTLNLKVFNGKTLPDLAHVFKAGLPRTRSTGVNQKNIYSRGFSAKERLEPGQIDLGPHISGVNAEVLRRGR